MIDIQAYDKIDFRKLEICKKICLSGAFLICKVKLISKLAVRK